MCGWRTRGRGGCGLLRAALLVPWRAMQKRRPHLRLQRRARRHRADGDRPRRARHARTRSSPSTTRRTTRPSGSRGRAGPRPARELARVAAARAVASSRMSDADRREAPARALRALRAGTSPATSTRASSRLATRLMPPLVTALLAPRTFASLRQDPVEDASASTRSTTRSLVEGPIDKLQRLVRARHRGLRADAPVEPGLDRLRLRARARGPAARHLRRREEPLHEPDPLVLHAQPRRLPRRPAHQAQPLQGRAQDVLVRAPRARLPLALLPGRHALALRRRRAAAQARPRRERHRGVRADAPRRARSGASSSCPRPSTTSITLEAETLIADFLSEEGKGRYIIEDDESTRLARVAAFVKKLLGMHGAVVIRFGQPLDPFGNHVDDDGVSHDGRGRAVDPASYVKNARGRGRRSIRRATRSTRASSARRSARPTRATRCRWRRTSPPRPASRGCARRARRATSSPCSASATPSPSRATSSPREVVRVRDALLALEREGGVRRRATRVRRASGRRHRRERARARSAATTRRRCCARCPRASCSRDTNLLFYYQNRLAAHGLAWDVIAPPGMQPVPQAAHPATAAAPSGGAA